MEVLSLLSKQTGVMKIILVFFLFLLLFLGLAGVSSASYDPSSTPNNKFGIHILFPQELADAAKLVNSAGGDWGYVTIPIQYSDRDVIKWQNFFNDCQTYHLIPIMRLATDPYFANTGVWRKPMEYDILDFANFLSTLSWPVKNRYVILYNETNRYDEWGGEPPSPKDYADLVMYAEHVFKAASPDFFLITAGLDNASPNDRIKYMDNFEYLREMGAANPDVFKNIDGFASHSYPNPDFSKPPTLKSPEGTSTYEFEEDIISGFAGSSKPVFITETGWNAQKLPGSVISAYYKDVFSNLWGQDQNVVAVTPFLLDSQNGQFDKLSFMKENVLTDYGKTYQDIGKTKGLPFTTPINIPIRKVQSGVVLSVFDFKRVNDREISIKLDSGLMKNFFKAILSIGK